MFGVRAGHVSTPRCSVSMHRVCGRPAAGQSAAAALQSVHARHLERKQRVPVRGVRGRKIWQRVNPIRVYQSLLRVPQWQVSAPRSEYVLWFARNLQPRLAGDAHAWPHDRP